MTETVGARHASRASVACARCKRVKRRCDAAQLSGTSASSASIQCTPCRQRGLNCDVRREDDKRSARQRGRTSDRMLRERVDALEELVTRLESGGPSQPVETSALQTPSSQTCDVNERPNYLSLPSPSTVNDATPPQSAPALTQCQQVEIPRDKRASATTNPPPNTVLPKYRAEPDSSTRMSSGFPAGMDEVTIPTSDWPKNKGKQSDSYFGSSSMFPYSEQCNQSSLGADRIQALVMEADPEPQPIADHLLDLFWTWQSSYLIVVDRDIFMRYRRLAQAENGSADRTFYSPCLLYAILALASMISPDQGVKKYSAVREGFAGERFSQKAKALLERELEFPMVTTVQAALIIASTYGANAENSLGWVYSGIAFRIAGQLGLHLNCSSAVNAGHMSAAEAECRRAAFWGCYVEDKSWSSYYSRPTVFMDWDITVDLPHGDSPDLEYSSPSLRRNIVLLSRIRARTLLGVYAQRRNYTANELHRLALEIDNDLTQWRNNLPHDLTWQNDSRGNRSVSPHVYMLHLEFNATMILVHRPFLDFAQIRRESTRCSEGWTKSLSACTAAATKIADLLHQYQSRFGSVERISIPAIHFTFIAATIHMVVYRVAKLEKHRGLLEGCLRALHNIGRSYPVSLKAASIIENLVEQWSPSEDAGGEKQTGTDHSASQPHSGNERDTASVVSAVDFAKSFQQVPNASVVEVRPQDSWMDNIFGANLDFNMGYGVPTFGESTVSDVSGICGNYDFSTDEPWQYSLSHSETNP